MTQHRDADRLYLHPSASTFAPRDTPGLLAFHRALSGYAPTPLVCAPHLAAALGVRTAWIKDESSPPGPARLQDSGSFLGGLPGTGNPLRPVSPLENARGTGGPDQSPRAADPGGRHRRKPRAGGGTHGLLAGAGVTHPRPARHGACPRAGHRAGRRTGAGRSGHLRRGRDRCRPARGHRPSGNQRHGLDGVHPRSRLGDRGIRHHLPGNRWAARRQECCPAGSRRRADGGGIAGRRRDSALPRSPHAGHMSSAWSRFRQRAC